MAKTKKNAIRVLCVIAALGIFYIIFCAVIGNKKFYPNTQINGIDVSSMTVSEAAEAVSVQFEKEYGSASVEVAINEETYCISVVEALDMDVTDAVQEINDKGHKFFSRGFNYIKALFKSGEYEAKPSLLSEELLYTAIEESGITKLTGNENKYYEITDESITLTKGRGGYVVDTDSLVAILEEVIENGLYTEVQECPLTYGEIDLQTIYDEIYTEPVDATLDADNDYSITESVTGVSFDLEEAETLLSAAADGEEVVIDLIYTEPEITTEVMEERLFRDVLGSFSTNVSGTSARKTNVRLAAEICNGTILLPGEQFSFNEVVGQRTTERGFLEAPAYSNGESVEAVGGGICQVSSTIYVACLYANLQIDQRQNHSYPSSYVKMGLDATVSWGGPDFVFTNDTDYPIKVVSSYSDGVVYCTIYGTMMEEFSVSLSTEVLATYAYETEYEDDDTLEAGEEKVSVEGKTGYKVQSYRTVYDGDGNVISSEVEAVSTYKKRNEVILVGTKEEETEEETEEATEEATEAAANSSDNANQSEDASTTQSSSEESNDSASE